MEDGSGKCLLDVISDPSALNEFLRSNSQISIDGDASPPKTQAFQENNLLRTSQAYTTHSSLLPGNTAHHVVNSKPPISLINSSVSHTVVRNVNGSTSNAPNSSRQVSLAKTNSPVNNSANIAKVAISTVSYQSKKPIPIQPKNPVILPNTSIQSAVNVRGAVSHGRVSQTPTSLMSAQTPTSLMSNQLQMATGSVLTRAHTPSTVNGIDGAKSRATPFQSNRTVQPTILTTPPKRIAPKQVISPPTNASIAMTTPIRIQQTNIQNKQNVQLIQAPAVQGTASNASKLFPQHLATVVRPLVNNNPGSTIVQATVANTVQPVQQIQQLINDKLSVQPTQTSSSGQTQQKVFTQAQLQTALKQSQVIAQNSPGQTQNILVQQQILKQLIQQAQQLQQQKQTEKQANVNTSTNAQGVIPIQQQAQVVKQGSLPQQVTVANQIPGNNQIQMVLPNQIVIPANQQTVNVSQNVVSTTNSTQNLSSKVQPMIIVSQAGGNLVLQQHVQSSNSGITAATSGSTVNIPLQNMLQQQKQIQGQIKTTSIQQTVQQPAKTTGNTVVQIQQPKQVAQPTLLVQNQGIQRQNTTTIKQGNTQQNVIIQAKPAAMTTQAGTTIQQLTPGQLQQLQNSGGVQKVLIIKQPEVLQKLTSVQGGKAPQAIQITAQQLQALQQMQNQQTSTAQKILIQSKTDGNIPSTTVLTAQQLKQLQQSLQHQTGTSKIVQIPQKQTLVQQIQNTKTPANKMAHVPRILQTTGRQVTSQTSTKTTTVKQEQSRGMKRPHTETPEPPKVVRRLKTALYQDQQAVTHPDIHTPFKNRLDAINKLRCYHVYHDPGQTTSDIQKSDLLFQTVSMQLIKKSEKMMEKYRSLVLDESMRKEPSSEMVMLYRLFLTDERAALAQDKRHMAEEIKALQSAPKVPLPASANITNTPTDIPEKTPEKSQSPITIPITPPLALQEIETTEPDILTSDSILDSQEESLLSVNDNDDDDEGSDVEPEESEIDKAVFNMESSASYYKPVNHIADSLIDSPRTSIGHNDGDESVEELMIDDETEKEDVTATLALLHSMAEELEGTIS